MFYDTIVLLISGLDLANRGSLKKFDQNVLKVITQFVLLLTYKLEPLGVE